MKNLMRREYLFLLIFFLLFLLGCETRDVQNESGQEFDESQITNSQSQIAVATHIIASTERPTAIEENIKVPETTLTSTNIVSLTPTIETIKLAATPTLSNTNSNDNETKFSPDQSVVTSALHGQLDEGVTVNFVNGLQIATNVKWSPNSEWLAFWVSTEEDLSNRTNFSSPPPGHLNFINVLSSNWCSMKSIQFESVPINTPDYFLWSDTELIISSKDQNQTIYVEPCLEGSRIERIFTPRADLDIDIQSFDNSVSPNGEMNVDTQFEQDPDNNQNDLLFATTNFILTSSGEVIFSLTWNSAGGVGTPGLGGGWVNDTYFLISSTRDQGPLLIDVSSQKSIPIVELADGLYETSLELSYSTLIAYSIPLNPDKIFIQDFAEPRDAWIFSIEDSQLDLLPYQNFTSPLFINNKTQTYLVLEKRIGSGIQEKFEVWTRPVENNSDDWVMLDSGMDYALWNDIGTEVVFTDGSKIRWKQFPSGSEYVATQSDKYWTNPILWSHDHRSIVLHGTIPDQQGQALFILTNRTE